MVLDGCTDAKTTFRRDVLIAIKPIYAGQILDGSTAESSLMLRQEQGFSFMHLGIGDFLIIAIPLAWLVRGVEKLLKKPQKKPAKSFCV